MLHIYYNKQTHTAYVSKGLIYASKNDNAKPVSDYQMIKYENVESVTQDKDRGQILMHGKMGQGIMGEYPLGRTSVSCQLAEKAN